MLNQHLLCCLIRPPAQCPSSALHYGIRTQTAENAGLVIFGGVEVGDNDIVGVGKVGIAGRADSTHTITLAGKLTSVGAFDTEDMAVGRAKKDMLAVVRRWGRGRFVRTCKW